MLLLLNRHGIDGKKLARGDTSHGERNENP